MTTPSNWHIRVAARADLSALVALEQKCFDYSQIGYRSFRYLIDSPTAHFVVCLSATQELLGYYILLTRKNSMKWRLYSIATAPEHRGFGLGKTLLRHALSKARQGGAEQFTLEVKVDNTAAIELYRRHHFEVVDLLPDYYGRGADGYRMALTLAVLDNLENR